ncbi:long-chain fatty alcohol dehydrogenase [Tuber magnatum]|uniref:Long-chain-alcohol oxidase n=1 Tax=Tuber magnatum TaxID=42249 RepID=A0A317T446_9PEZI|nr:long-chain fatty alcohol dehydrogenase [Tuber magnatum]
MASDNPHNFPSTLTPNQWITLYAITSAIIRPFTEDEITAYTQTMATDISREHVKSFLLEEANYTNPRFRYALEHTLEQMLPKSSVQAICFVLNLLDSVPGCLLLTFSLTPFHRQPACVREDRLISWLDQSSRLLFPPIRGFAKAITALTKLVWTHSADTDMYYGAVGYQEKTGAGVKALDGEPGEFYKFEFLDFSDGEKGMLECDVVIVGSGCGGAVAAARLAREGLDVVVVDRGEWVPSDQLPLRETEALAKLYNGRLASTTADGVIALIAGETFGGGGVVNWAASLQTQGFVREEWATKHDLPFFLSNDYQDCLDKVCERMGVTAKGITHNHRNQTMLEGCRKLGYSAVVVPQNTGATLPGDEEGTVREHADGYCSNGCGCGKKGDGRKMGTTHTWLPDAARTGARFIQSYHVDRVLFSTDAKTKAIGVTGTWGAQKVPLKIMAKKVIVSAGSLHSPCLLLRSGLTNPNIGKYLHLHPGVTINAFFPEPTDPWVGSPLTTACTEFENLDGSHHGGKLETAVMCPLLVAATLPWLSSASLKRTLLNYRRSGLFFTIQRECEPGMVTLNTRGEPTVKYTISEADRAMIQTSLLGLAKILYVQGAVEISPAEEEEGTCGHAMHQFNDPGIMDRRFQRWLKKFAAHGMGGEKTIYGSAHQMGGCRMGNDGGVGSVVDPKGRVWGVEGLLVADASVLPSACGVNPMITVMAITKRKDGGVEAKLL